MRRFTLKIGMKNVDRQTVTVCDAIKVHHIFRVREGVAHDGRIDIIKCTCFDQLELPTSTLFRRRAEETHSTRQAGSV